MTIHQHRATVTTSSGSTSSTTLNILGGICRQVLIVANTSSTTFLSYITDEAGLEVARYGSQTGELDDITSIPMAGRYVINITNASPEDTFKILLGVQE